MTNERISDFQTWSESVETLAAHLQSLIDCAVEGNFGNAESVYWRIAAVLDGVLLDPDSREELLGLAAGGCSGVARHAGRAGNSFHEVSIKLFLDVLFSIRESAGAASRRGYVAKETTKGGLSHWACVLSGGEVPSAFMAAETADINQDFRRGWSGIREYLVSLPDLEAELLQAELRAEGKRVLASMTAGDKPGDRPEKTNKRRKIFTPSSDVLEYQKFRKGRGKNHTHETDARRAFLREKHRDLKEAEIETGQEALRKSIEYAMKQQTGD